MPMPSRLATAIRMLGETADLDADTDAIAYIALKAAGLLVLCQSRRWLTEAMNDALDKLIDTLDPERN